MFDPSSAFDPTYWRQKMGALGNSLGLGAPPPTPGTTLNSNDPNSSAYGMPMASGVTPPSNLVFQDRIQDLQQDAADAGIPNQMISGDRSVAKQQQLWNLRQAGQWPNPVAYPGSSMHNRGLAADVAATNPSQQGQLVGMAREPWRGISPGANFNDPNHFQMGNANGGPVPAPVTAQAKPSVAPTPGTSLSTQSPYANVIGALSDVAAKPFDQMASALSGGYIPQGTVTNALSSGINSMMPSGGPTIPSTPVSTAAPASINPMAGLSGLFGGGSGGMGGGFMSGLSKLAGGLGGNKQPPPQAPPPPNMQTNSAQIAAAAPNLMKQLMNFYRLPEIGGAA